MKVALIQLTSGNDIAANIAKIEKLVKRAAAQGAEFAALPENAFYMRAEGQAAPPKYTQATHPGVKAAAQMAKQHGIWLLAGSVAIQKSEKNYNRSLLFAPQGKIVARYDKIHLFDVQIGDGQTYRESAKFLSGKKAVVGGIRGWKDEKMRREKAISPHPLISSSSHPILGLSICYDLRFPQLYRALAKKGAVILAVPSAFTQVTGEAHWHVLLRARAIENGCFVIAPAQTGEHPGGRRTYGHSLVVDPWGKILADGRTEEGLVMAEIDLDEVNKVRKKLPSLEHDREFK